MNHQMVKVKQQIRWGEAFSLGCCEMNNHYSVQDASGGELFRVLEDSECMNRCCCAPGHTYDLKVVPAGAREPMANSPILVHRDGCCADGMCHKCLGCFTCGESCQNVSEVFAGQDGGFMIEEKLMNGCTAETVISKVMTGGQDNLAIAVIHGPTFFGGCIECCIDSDWMVTTCDKQGNVTGTPGDIGRIRKKKPEGLCGMFRECCTDIDNYEIEFAQHAFNGDPNFRGAVLAGLFHTDYQFFEYDQPMCGMNSDNSAILITICNFYCYGCICPVQCCIPTKDGG